MTVRLSLMMFLEFVVFGSWFATLGLVLATAKLPTIIGAAYTLAAVAAIVSPMFLGAIGDRYFSGQKVLGVVHLVGGLLMLGLPSAVRAGEGEICLILMFAYMLCFQPTLGLTNAIALRHLGAEQGRFPFIRVWGTIGWVVAGLAVGLSGLSASPNVFYVTAAASLGFSIYAFTLPSTPPAARGHRFSIGDVVGAKAFSLLRQRDFLVFMVCATLTSIALGVYNTFSSPYLGALGIGNVAGVLALGQISEVIFIVTIPWVLARIGMKWSLFLGMCMWGVRFALFILAAHAHAGLAVVAVALHGICSDFFLILGAMYVDRVAPVRINAQAQSMLVLVVSGIGAFIGSSVSGQIFGTVVAATGDPSPLAWTPVWLFPIATAAITAVLWVIFFRPAGDRPRQAQSSS